MNYLSLSFAAFVLVSVLLSYILPAKLRWCVLLSSSLIFYACFDLRYLAFLLTTAMTTYCCARLLPRSPSKKWSVGGCVALNVGIWSAINEILISKTYNRYYIIQQAIAADGRDYEVQIFGACHSYTSFDAGYFEDTFGLTAYDLGMPGQIIPTTYLHMVERFKKDVPQVALVEIWGINAYETYSSPERIFEYYMPVDVEVLPFSPEKQEVIRDFYSLDPLLENFPIAKYKDRIMDMELREADFDYSFDQIAGSTSAYTREEMTMRIANNGFCEMPMWLEPEQISQYYSPYRDVSDYHERQPDVPDDETLALEADLLKYVEKIIDLCDGYGVELIFYRAPYISTENELKKANGSRTTAKKRESPISIWRKRSPSTCLQTFSTTTI